MNNYNINTANSHLNTSNCPQGKIEHYETPSIHIDYREEKSGVFDIINKQKEFFIEKSVLEVGDFLVADITIERKTISDFASSLTDGRLFKQLYHLKHESKKRILLIEGSLENALSQEDFKSAKFSSITTKSFKGALIKIVAGLQIPTFTTTNINDTAETILQLARQEFKFKPSYYAPPQKRPEGELQKYIEILSGIPNVGGSKAMQLLRHFKTLKAIFNATKEELMTVQGIGEKQANEMFDVANREWGK